jgi:hypothetical protein
MVQLSCYLAERSLQEYSLLRYLPSVIATSAILIARKTLKRHPWSPTLLKYTSYDETHIAPCVAELGATVQASETAPQQGVLRKYSSPKFGSVGQLPLVF